MESLLLPSCENVGNSRSLQPGREESFARKSTGSGHGFDEVQFLSLLTGENRGLFVVFHQLFHRAELSLPDTVQSILELDLEMLVLALCFQGNGEVIWL